MATLDTILNIKVEGTDSMVKLKTAIDTTAKELKDLQKEGKKAGQTQDQFNAKVVTAETKLKGMRGELNKSKTELIKNAKAAGDTSKSYNSLVKANAKFSAEARKLADPLGKNKKAFSELTAKMKANEAQLKKMDKSMGRNQRNVGNYKQALSSVAMGIGAVIIAFKAFERVLSTFVDFQFQMKQVGVISGATAVELDMLTQSAKELGSSTAFTAGEVAALQTELAKLGFDPTEIDNMTASVLDLAFAFDKDLAETGTTIAVVLNSYKLEATEASRVTDILANAFASTSLDLEKFNVAFPKVGAIAKQLGFSLEGTTAILGSLTNAGIEASTAGTSLRSIFLKLADSNSALSKKLGGSATSIETLLPALKKLSEDGTDVNEMLGLTDKRSVTAFATLVSGIPDVQKLTKEFENSAGTTKKFADVMRDSLKGSLDEAKSAAGGFVIELFEKLEPTINLIVQGVGLLFNALSGLINNLGAVTIGAAAYGVVVLANAFATGALTTALIAEKVALAATAVANYIAATATRVFNSAIFANPIGLFIGLLTTGIALLFDWGGASDEAAGKQDGVTESLEGTTEELTKLEKVQKKYNDKQIKELSNLKLLAREIQNTNLTQNERLEKLKAFNKLSGSNIKNLKDEKKLTAELNNAMEGTIDAIKRKIILEGSSEKLTILLEEQLVLDQQIEESLDAQATNTANAQLASENLAKAELERANAGARSALALIEDGEKLGSLNERAISDVALLEQSQKNSFATQQSINKNLTAAAQQDGYMSQQLHNQQAGMLSAEIYLKEEKLAAIENETTAIEDQSVSESSSAENVLNLRREVGNVIQTNNELKEVEVELQTQSDVLENQINEIYTKREKALSKLTGATTKTGGAAKATKTAYQLLAGEVTIYDAVLKKSVTDGANEMRTFLSSEEAKAMSVEDKNKRIIKIEEETAKKVKIAAGLVIKAKADLKVVDDALAKQYEIINFESNEYIATLKKQAVESQKNIDIDKRQLGVLTELEKAGADVANERIRLALKIAQAELNLAIKTAEASDISTQAQIDNLHRLKAEIDGFQEQLKDDDEGGGGWLNKVMFGTDEDGGEFTMEDFLTSMQIGLDVVNEMLTTFNEKQKQELSNKLGVITAEKDAEVKSYKESAQYEIDTDEVRAKKIEDIKKKHDDAMLILQLAQFEKDKKFQRAQAIIGGATAIMNILKGQATGNVIADAIIKGVLIAAVIGTTAMQIGMINSQAAPTAETGAILDDSFFATGGMVVGKSHKNGGEKFKVGGRVAELEGGEAVINKRSTAMFKPMLSKMNVAGGGKKFADGGMVFADGGMTFGTDSMQDEQSIIADSIVDSINSQQVLLVEADVTQSQNEVKTIQSRVSF